MITVTLDGMDLFLEVHHFLYSSLRIKLYAQKAYNCRSEDKKGVEMMHLF